MCLAIPMQIIEIEGEFAQVQAGTLRRRINVALLPKISPGDYVMVHAGFAIQKVDRKKAEETLKFIHALH